MDPGIPVSRVRTIGDLVAATSATARFATGIMSAFGVSALLLAISILAACLAPAWRASHVEPKVALEDG